MSPSRKPDPPRRSRGSHSAVQRPSAPRRRPAHKQDMPSSFDQLVLQNPRLASSVLAALKIIAGADRQRAMQLIETVSAVVLSMPARAPGPEGP